MYFMHNVIPPPHFIGDPPILEKQRQIRPEHNNLWTQRN